MSCVPAQAAGVREIALCTPPRASGEVCPETLACCELLGIDPLFVANEGKLLAVVAENEVERALEILRGHHLGNQAACIGTILAREIVPIQVLNTLGRLRSLDEPSGAPLPRIC